MMQTLSIGVIGCGYWGPNLARNFRTAPNCLLKYVCDLHPQRLEHLHSLYPEARPTRRAEDLFDDPHLDAIALATPAPTHFALAKAALLSGKHVLVEKPLATSSSECSELVSLAAARGLTLMVGHTFLYAPAIRAIKDLMESGELGEIRYIAARRLNFGVFQRAINVVWDLAPHDISIVNALLGRGPLSVSCHGSSHVTPGIEDVAMLSMDYGRGITALVHNSWLDPRKVREITIVGSRRMIVYDDVVPHEKIKIFDTRVSNPPYYDTFGEFQFAYHYGETRCPYIRDEEPLKAECNHFLTSIRNKTQPLSDGTSGLEVVRVIEAAIESLHSDGAPKRLAEAGRLQALPDSSAVPGAICA